MKKIQILWDFIRLSVTEKVAFYQNVIAKLTDNPTYPSPPIALSDAQTAVDTLDASIIAARDGSHFAVSTMCVGMSGTKNMCPIRINLRNIDTH